MINPIDSLFPAAPIAIFIEDFGELLLSLSDIFLGWIHHEIIIFCE